MLQRKKPATHTVDGAAIYIYNDDPAWNSDMIQADFDALEAAASVKAQAEAVERFKENSGREVSDAELDEVRAACFLTVSEARKARALHPVQRYYDGVSRFQLSTPDWRPDGTPCTVRDYLSGKPATFGISRLGLREYHEVFEANTDRAGSMRTRSAFLDAFEAGLRSVKMDDYTWSAKGDERAGKEQLAVFDDLPPDLATSIGSAVLSLSRPLDSAEKEPSAARG